jgi:hypothetical protein
MLSSLSRGHKHITSEDRNTCAEHKLHDELKTTVVAEQRLDSNGSVIKYRCSQNKARKIEGAAVRKNLWFHGNEERHKIKNDKNIVRAEF